MAHGKREAAPVHAAPGAPSTYSHGPGTACGMNTRSTDHSKVNGLGNQAMTPPGGASKPAGAGADESGS